MRFKKTKEGKEVNLHLDSIQKQYSFHIFVRQLPDAKNGGIYYIKNIPIKSINGHWVSHWPRNFTVYGMPPCHHYNESKSCVCNQQGRRKLYRLIKRCFQGKNTLADLLHYMIWNTHMKEKEFTMLNLIELVKRLRATCQNPENLV